MEGVGPMSLSDDKVDIFGMPPIMLVDGLEGSVTNFLNIDSPTNNNASLQERTNKA